MFTLKSYRQYKAISQKELADRVGMSNLTISNIEKQVAEPNDETRRRLEVEVGQRIDWISTLGLKEISKKSWEECEQDLRHAILQAQGLTELERKQFNLIAKEYLTSFENLVSSNKILNNEYLLPDTETYRKLKDQAKDNDNWV
jgi:transcriptional regulator with XRE-family HTH domain